MEEDEDVIEVSMWEWEEANAPERIRTTGMGPCIGIILYHPLKKRALVGHFPGVGDCPDPALEMMLDEVPRRLQRLSNVKVYVGGGVIDAGDDGDWITVSREAILKALRKAGFKDTQMTVEWGKPNHCVVMSLDTETGRVEFDSEDLSELDDADWDDE